MDSTTRDSKGVRTKGPGILLGTFKDMISKQSHVLSPFYIRRQAREIQPFAQSWIGRERTGQSTISLNPEPIRVHAVVAIGLSTEQEKQDAFLISPPP